MPTLSELVYRLLEWTIDDQWANNNTVLKQGLVIQGEWKTGRLFVHGEELEREGWDELEKPWGQLRDPTPKFRWGDESTESQIAAQSILEWFLDDDEVAAQVTKFTKEVVAAFPKSDFRVNFNYVGWRNGNSALWDWCPPDPSVFGYY